MVNSGNKRESGGGTVAKGKDATSTTADGKAMCLRKASTTTTGDENENGSRTARNAMAVLSVTRDTLNGIKVSGGLNTAHGIKRERMDIISPEELPVNWDHMNRRQKKDYFQRHWGDKTKLRTVVAALPKA
jgi:hypothetical protein